MTRTVNPVPLTVRVNYALAYKRHEAAYASARALVAAHRRAQHQLPEFYGHARRAGDGPETAAEAQVVLESAWQCRAVERNIQRIAPGLARIVDTDVVAHHVLDVLSRVETTFRCPRWRVLPMVLAAYI